MYIKQVIIQGFKSYKEQTVIEPFSPKHNVIVGRNGSGKSNFFAAIRFVLGDAYTHMGREERNALLHEGTGSAVMSAFVEVIFDNGDDRFPTGKPELVLRRTIGMKKDEYTLDRKSVTKSDVMNLLESAGFSRANPYYIVPQGRVTALTNMKDGERLTLLKDVAGTQVYESRRIESLKIIEDTKNRREKIDELLQYIHQRLSELEEEKEELRDFQEKDRDRRCLQYSLDHREQLTISDELENLEEQRQTGVAATDDNAEKFLEGEKALEGIDSRLNELKQQMEFLTIDKQQLNDQRKTGAKELAKMEMEISRLRMEDAALTQTKNETEIERKDLIRKIEGRRAALKDLLPQYEAKEQAESLAKVQLDDAEASRRRLYEKQGRNANFRNKTERDAWLQEQMQNLVPQLTKITALQNQNAEEISRIEHQITADETSAENLRRQISGHGSKNESLRALIDESKLRRDRLMDERKELWREDMKLDSISSNAQAQFRAAEKDLSHTMDKDTSRGIAAINRLKHECGLSGIYGIMAELMEVDDYFKRAIEVTAGQSLFHCIVDTDETASKAIEILVREKLGRLTFIPLNRVKPKQVNIPRANDAIPMIEKITFDPQLTPAFQQVFGSSIICPTLTVAGQYARSHGVNGVTLDGDRSDRRGAFTGGSVDHRNSRITASRQVSKWRHELETSRARMDEIKEHLERKDQEVTMAVGEMQRLEQQNTQLESAFNSLRQDLKGFVASIGDSRTQLEQKLHSKNNIESSLRDLTAQHDAYKREMDSVFKRNLTNEEEGELESLNASVQELGNRHAEAASVMLELASQRKVLEIDLRENLEPRLDQLQAQDLEEIVDNRSIGTHGRRGLKGAQADLARMQKAQKDSELRLQDLRNRLDEMSTAMTNLSNERADRMTTQSEIATAMERFQKRMEKSVQKRRILMEQAQAVNTRIRELGILPHGALERFERCKSDDIVRQLHTVTQALKKYSHVNKKAFEQYNNFTMQRNTLISRREELDNSHASISELIAVLDQRKDEAIERTFKQVSKEFATVFEKLVPAGRGRLVIQRKIDRHEHDDDDDDDDDDDESSSDDDQPKQQQQHASVENYTGVGISVSFNSKHDDQQRIQQLSGGQKSLCALALVFAIQQCDPAPFYLFDEIDANLDAQYRSAVANMLQEISERSASQRSNVENGNESPNSDSFGGGQFICTTFRPEMLLVAEKCYGVRYLSNKSSSVVVVDKEEALKFVEGEKPS